MVISNYFQTHSLPLQASVTGNWFPLKAWDVSFHIPFPASRAAIASPRFLDEWHFRVLHSGLAYAWDRPEALVKAMDIFEASLGGKGGVGSTDSGERGKAMRKVLCLQIQFLVWNYSKMCRCGLLPCQGIRKESVAFAKKMLWGSGLCRDLALELWTEPLFGNESGGIFRVGPTTSDLLLAEGQPQRLVTPLQRIQKKGVAFAPNALEP